MHNEFNFGTSLWRAPRISNQYNIVTHTLCCEKMLVGNPMFSNTLLEFIIIYIWLTLENRTPYAEIQLIC